MQSVGIIGFGCAGYNCAKTLRDTGFKGDIHVFSSTNMSPANPMLTTYYVADKLSFEGMFPFGKLENIITELALDFHSQENVTKLFAKEKKIITDKNKEYTFDKILISSGAKVFVPPIGDYPKDKVFFMRTTQDAIDLKNALKDMNVNTAVVVGASMVGIKIAEIFNNKGIKTVLADMSPYIFSLAATKKTASLIQDKIKNTNIELLFNSGITAIKENDDKLKVEFTTGDKTADIVVLAIGTRTDIGFVDTQEVEINRGIIVDDFMNTSAKDIYAAGDCTCGTDIQDNTKKNIGLWANAGYQGRTAALSMLQKDVAYEGNILHNITHFMNMDFIGFGDVNAKGEEIEYNKNGFYFYAVRNNDRIELINIVDNHTISGPVKTYMMKKLKGMGEELGVLQKGILLRNGLPEKVINWIERKEA